MTIRADSPLRDDASRWTLLRSNRKIQAALFLLAFFLLAIVAHPVLQATLWADAPSTYDPATGYDTQIVHPSGPSAEHWLGTDSLGRDVFSMFTYAARFSVTVALAAGVAIGVTSLALGSVAAYRRGWVDGLITHLSDAMVLLPALLAVYVLGVGASSETFGALEVGLSFGVLYGMGPATGAVRAAALGVMAKPFIDAGRQMGAGGLWLVSRHVLPHVVPHAAVQAMIGVTGAVIAEAFLAFRSGVGDDVGFGYLIYEGLTWQELFAGVLATPWWIMIAGATGITLIAAGFYLFGVGLREVYDPRTVGTRR